MKQKRRNKRKTQLIMRRSILLVSVLLISVSIAFSITGFLSSAKDNSEPNYYKYYTSITINPGDTLNTIASCHFDSHFGSSKKFINEVMIINSLTDDNITSGMHLVIPYYSTEFK